MRTINVLFLASEADPLVKVGGLGDVAGSLPPALQQLGGDRAAGSRVEIRLVIPFHPVIQKKNDQPDFLGEFGVPTAHGSIPAQAFQVEVNGVCVVLIAGAPISHAEAGADTSVYSSDAGIDGPRYTFFSLAALELAKMLDWKPDILHANDWHTALSIYALKTRKSSDRFYQSVHSLLTLHNLPFMGVGTEDAFDFYGFLPSRYPRLPVWARKVPLPLGLQTADRIVAVSPTYAQEILTPEYGCGLEGFLKGRAKAISGIVNGIDQDIWNPATDPDITKKFTVASLKNRKQNKEALCNEFSLDPDPKIPLLILISRMDPQKGVDIAIAGLSRAQDSRWQAILLGTGDPFLEAACRKLEADHPDRVRCAIRFDAHLARRMYAGGDMLLMPSRYEPCGLAQMIAMRYGCVPLGRATGGLQDTILDTDSAPENRTGFLFKSTDAISFADTLQRALIFFCDQAGWEKIQVNGMRQDFSWKKSALQYAELYQELMEG